MTAIAECDAARMTPNAKTKARGINAFVQANITGTTGRVAKVVTLSRLSIRKTLEHKVQFRPKKVGGGPAGVIIAWEKEFAPQVTTHVLVEFVFQKGLGEMAAKVSIARKQSRIGGAGRSVVWREHCEVTGAEIELLERRDRPGGAEALHVGFLPDA